MGNLRSDNPLEVVSFRCRVCGEAFSAAPGRVVDAPERGWHPWLYFAVCPECGAEAEQAPWEKGLMATFGKHTGPRTPEGIAASAANLVGHPTPEEARRTRFNALKTGLRARVAAFFPARPGGYPHCNACEYLESEECRDHGACLKRTELFMRHQIAFESGDPKLLLDLNSDLQAKIRAIVDDMILAITATGVELKNPEWYFDPKGERFHLVSFEEDGETKYSYKISAHPLLKPLFEVLSKNNLSLADMGMTPKVQTDEELVRGHLEQQEQDDESSREYQRRSTEALEGLRTMIENSQRRVARDPVLIEHQMLEGSDG